MALNGLATWTALPNLLDQQGTPKLSVLVTPRLPSSGTLDDYDAFRDWPQSIQGLDFTVVFDNGLTLTGLTPTTTPDPTLWKRLFPQTTPVEPFEFKDHAAKNFHIFPVRPILHFLEQTYGALAASAGLDHPSIDLPGGPLRPFDHLGRIVSRGHDWPSYQQEAKGAGPQPEQTGEVVVDKWASPLGSDGDQWASAFQQAYRFYYRPGSRKPGLPDVEPYPDKPKLSDFPFHRMVAMLADHPELLRRLGLLLDLALTDPSDPSFDPAVAMSAQGTVWVKAPAISGVGSLGPPPKTRYLFDASGKLFLPRPADTFRMERGLLRLHKEFFDLFQVDVDGAAMKAVDFADTLGRLRDQDRRSDFTPGEAAVPALRSSGLAVSRFDRGGKLLQDLEGRRDKNSDLQDGLQVEFDAEDLVRGYRIDVRDDKAAGGPRWFSLHGRHSDHSVSDPAGAGPPLAVSHDDEGYVKGTSASSEREDHPNPSSDLYLHETMFGWDGWSLSAPRPGKRIVEPQQGENGGALARYQPDEDNPFPIVTRITPAPHTLPRLRFGHTYRMRARLVDLGGNSLPFTEEDLSDPQSQLESPPRTYLRFEPVPSPTVLRRRLDTEGESLEHLVLRSNQGVDAGAYAGLPHVLAALAQANAAHSYAGNSQRHLAPPKGSQQMAELQGMFDQAVGSDPSGAVTAALRMALREEGTFLDQQVVDLGTGLATLGQTTIQIFPASAAFPVPKGEPLQTGAYVVYPDDHVLLPYLPDPLAEGVAVIGFDHTGAEVFHAVAGFPGSWPDLQPFRLRLSEAAGPPSAIFDGGVLEVRLPKADQVRVRLSSIFPADAIDLFAVWNWIDNPTSQLRDRALEGRHWMLTPFRWLTFTHAVQQPLATPSFEQVESVRSLGETFATFLGPIANHAKSTGRLDVLASWTEDVDLLTEDAPRWARGGNPVGKTGHAFGFEIGEAEEPAQVSVVWHLQDKWRWCRTCQGLVFGGGDDAGVCLEGAGHLTDMSGNYLLAHNEPTDPAPPPGQSDWRWCKKCQGLAFGRKPPGKCFAGGQHNHGGSGNYRLVLNDPSAAGQSGWRWCKKCEGLAWGVDQAGPCPAGDSHDHSGSGAYTLRTAPTLPQDRISRHEFGDTKYRRVTYHTVATTRFREYFPAPLAADPANLQRVEPVEVNGVPSEQLVRHIRSSARPAAPDIVYLIPSFSWERTSQDGTQVHTRRGNAVRVYLRRPWFSSGDGELLGVVLRKTAQRRFHPDPVDATASAVIGMRRFDPDRGFEMHLPVEPIGLARTPRVGERDGRMFRLPSRAVQDFAFDPSLLKDLLEPYVTSWGGDPVWQGGHPPETIGVWSFPAHAAYATDVTLEELPPAWRVAVAGHEVHFDPIRKLWYADIEVDAEDAYVPFVRLALARFQPMSLEGAHLSRVAMTDFIQLLPDRTATVARERAGLKVTVRGVSGRNRIGDVHDEPEAWSPTTETWGQIQARVAGSDDDLAWRDVGETVGLDVAGVEGFRVTWKGTVPLLGAAVGAGTHRLLVTETETYQRDHEDGDPPLQVPIFVSSRITYADAFDL